MPYNKLFPPLLVFVLRVSWQGNHPQHGSHSPPLLVFVLRVSWQGDHQQHCSHSPPLLVFVLRDSWQSNHQQHGLRVTFSRCWCSCRGLRGRAITNNFKGCWCCHRRTTIRTTRNNGRQWASGDMGDMRIRKTFATPR